MSLRKTIYGDTKHSNNIFLKGSGHKASWTLKKNKSKLFFLIIEA